jgi:hypothetical protein
MGRDKDRLCLIALSNVGSIDRRANVGAAVQQNGTLVAWGVDTFGQVGASGTPQTCTGGDPCREAPIQVTLPASVKKVALGAGFTLALLDDGRRAPRASLPSQQRSVAVRETRVARRLRKS